MSLHPQNATKVLLSIKPEFVDKIFGGKKNFEYRKVIFRKQEIDTVIVYASTPTRRVIGEFKVVAIHEHSPEALKKGSGLLLTHFNILHE